MKTAIWVRILLSSEALGTLFVEPVSSTDWDWEPVCGEGRLVAVASVDKELGLSMGHCLFAVLLESCFLNPSADRISSAETFLKNIPLKGLDFDLLLNAHF